MIRSDTILQLVEVLARITLIGSEKFLLYKVSKLFPKCPLIPPVYLHILSLLPIHIYLIPSLPILTHSQSQCKMYLFLLPREIHAPTTTTTITAVHIFT